MNPYPLSLLQEIYRTKRRRMEKLLERFRQQIDVPGLLIDGMCRELGDVLTVSVNLTVTAVKLL